MFILAKFRTAKTLTLPTFIYLIRILSKCLRFPWCITFAPPRLLWPLTYSFSKKWKLAQKNKPSLWTCSIRCYWYFISCWGDFVHGIPCSKGDFKTIPVRNGNSKQKNRQTSTKRNIHWKGNTFTLYMLSFIRQSFLSWALLRLKIKFLFARCCFIFTFSHRI